jgi:hypothetical protein
MVDMYIRGGNMSTVESCTSPPCTILTHNTASIETSGVNPRRIDDKLAGVAR